MVWNKGTLHCANYTDTMQTDQWESHQLRPVPFTGRGEKGLFRRRQKQIKPENSRFAVHVTRAYLFLESKGKSPYITASFPGETQWWANFQFVEYARTPQKANSNLNPFPAGTRKSLSIPLKFFAFATVGKEWVLTKFELNLINTFRNTAMFPGGNVGG